MYVRHKIFSPFWWNRDKGTVWLPVARPRLDRKRQHLRQIADGTEIVRTNSREQRLRGPPGWRLGVLVTTTHHERDGRLYTRPIADAWRVGLMTMPRRGHQIRHGATVYNFFLAPSRRVDNANRPNTFTLRSDSRYRRRLAICPFVVVS